MRISRRSFEGCADAAWSLAERKPFAGVWGNAEPEQLFSQTASWNNREWGSEHCCLSSICLLICTTRRSQAARELVFFSSWRHLHRASYVHCCLLLRHIFLEVEALSSCKISAAQHVTDCICHSHLERVCWLRSAVSFLIGEKGDAGLYSAGEEIQRKCCFVCVQIEISTIWTKAMGI